MKKEKIIYILYTIIFLKYFFFTSCGPSAQKTIEQQVESILKSEDEEKRLKVSYALADSLNIKAFELLLGLHSNYKATDALKNILYYYSKKIKTDSSRREKILDCIKYITEPISNIQDSLNEKKIELIIYALQIDSLDKFYEETLINVVKQHGNGAMIKIIEAWYLHKNSKSLLNAIKSFDNDAITYLVNKMETDKNAVDLLAHFGRDAVNIMLEKMKDDNQSVRFAAASVLVYMLNYDPNAVDVFISAIGQGNIKLIAKNYPFYIRLGLSGTEKLLLKALDSYFDIRMCEDYLNCGNKELEDGATKIANKYGYLVFPRLGNHDGPKWGSGN
jgi:hypothetical protein